MRPPSYLSCRSCSGRLRPDYPHLLRHPSDVRVSGRTAATPRRAEDCLKRRNCPLATDRDPFVADPGHYSLGGSFHR